VSSPKSTAILRDLWYLAAPARRVRPGKLHRQTVCGEPLVFGRKADGEPFVMRDMCPHRGMPLSAGTFDGQSLHCPYHGWAFDTAGLCTRIPCLSESEAHDLRKVRVKTYPCRELQGNVWVWFGKPHDDLPPVPEVPDFGDRAPDITGTMVYDCDIDNAALGLVDSAHGPFVHRSWFWRSPKKLKEKRRRVVPSHLGFTIASHEPSSNSWIFRFFKDDPEIQIRFQLPGVHIESFRSGEHRLGGYIIVTPVDETTTEIHYGLFSNLGWLRPLHPILRLFVRSFFRQDLIAMRTLAQNREHGLPQLFVGGPDEQSRLYYRLKREHEEARSERREFENPVEEHVLAWRT